MRGDINPERLFAGVESKQLHYTGRISAWEWENNLFEPERKDWGILVDVMSDLGGMMGASLCVLGVGSVANLSSTTHHDVDLLVCVEPRKKRFEYINTMTSKAIELDWRVSACIIAHAFIAQQIKIVGSEWTQFDVNILGGDRWSTREILEYHNEYNLAHAILL